jgi:hypothetical protein
LRQNQKSVSFTNPFVKGFAHHRHSCQWFVK